MNRCHLLVEWADLAAAAARAPAHFRAARCSVSVANGLRPTACPDHKRQSELDFEFGLPDAVDGQTAAKSSAVVACSIDGVEAPPPIQRLLPK